MMRNSTSPARMFVESRQSPRYDFENDSTVTVSWDGGAKICDGRLVNISKTGFLLECAVCASSIASDEPLAVKLEIPGRRGLTGGGLSCQAARSVRLSDGKVRLGVRLTSEMSDSCWYALLQRAHGFEIYH